MRIDDSLLQDLTNLSKAFPDDTLLSSMLKHTKNGERSLLKSISTSEDVVTGLGGLGTLNTEELKALDMLSSFAEGIYRKTLTQYAAFKHSLKMLEEGIDSEGLALWMETSGKDKETLLIETKAAMDVISHIIAHWIDEFDKIRTRG